MRVENRLEKGKNAQKKRIFDITVGLLLIIIALPVMLFVALGVAVSLGRPIIFKQVRVGQGERGFEMLKFRSMREGEGERWTTGIDKRKTRFGNFIRRYSLDELPQLFNVLRGEMSLVGPRPEIPRFAEKFQGEIPLYPQRHLVKPGITGLAQIKGLRGNTSLEERVEADIYYIENWSLLLDLKILFMTPQRMLNRSERYTGDKNG